MMRLDCGVGRFLLATLVAFAADASAQERMICGQPFDGDIAALAQRIRQLPHASGSPSKNLFGLEGIIVRPHWALQPDGPGGTLWNFTPPDHPAHPSVSCWRLVNTGGRRLSQNQFECEAAKERCDQLAAESREREQTIQQIIELWQDGKRLN